MASNRRGGLTFACIAIASTNALGGGQAALHMGSRSSILTTGTPVGSSPRFAGRFSHGSSCPTANPHGDAWRVHPSTLDPQRARTARLLRREVARKRGNRGGGRAKPPASGRATVAPPGGGADHHPRDHASPDPPTVSSWRMIADADRWRPLDSDHGAGKRKRGNRDQSVIL